MTKDISGPSQTFSVKTGELQIFSLSLKPSPKKVNLQTATALAAFLRQHVLPPADALLCSRAELWVRGVQP